MLIKKGMSKSEIEKFLEDKGDFVRIDHLTRFLNQGLSIDMKKFVYLKLIEIYKKRRMFSEAGKNYSHAAESSITFNEKIDYHVKSVEMFAKAGEFDRADKALQMALNNANTSQKPEIFLAVKENYKKQAVIYEKERRHGHASKMYEKLAGMKNLSDSEREEIREKLLELYDKLGRVREYMMLKGKFD